MKRIVICIITLLMLLACGNDPTVPPEKKALFRIISLDKCDEVSNGTDHGITVGCTAQNYGNDCGSTSVRLWVEQKAVTVDETTKPISLCPYQTAYVEATLWKIQPDVQPTECFCACT